MSSRIHVAVGVIYNADKDKVLISKRLDNQHLAGLWEFPGGKVEQNEGVQTALARELYEELGIVVNKTKALKKISFDYPDKKVLLDVWLVDDWHGKASGRESQEVKWVLVDELHNYNFPDANQYIIPSIRLPDTCLISQPNYEDIEHLFSVTEKCFTNGLKLFQLRLDNREAHNYKLLIERLMSLAGSYNAKLILNGSPPDIEQYRIDGIHLKTKELFKNLSRPIDKKYILGASCHNEKELEHAERLDVDYVFISPVLATKSHPDKTPMGWLEFKQLVGKTNISAYALGGLCAKDLERAKTEGAQGIAMLSSVWSSNS